MLTFSRDVLRSQKKLMTMDIVDGISRIPLIRELDSSIILQDIKADSQIAIYVRGMFATTDKTSDEDYII